MIKVLEQMVDALEHELSIDWTSNEEFNASAEKMHDAIKAGKQLIAELESQEPVAVRLSNGVIDCLGTAIVPIGALLYAHPPQRKPLTDGDFLDWYDSAIWGNEDFEQCCQIAFEAGWQFAHGIKE